MSDKSIIGQERGERIAKAVDAERATHEQPSSNEKVRFIRTALIEAHATIVRARGSKLLLKDINDALGMLDGDGVSLEPKARTYKAGDVSPHSDVYLAADIRRAEPPRARCDVHQRELECAVCVGYVDGLAETKKACTHRFTMDKGLDRPRDTDKCDGCDATWLEVQSAYQRPVARCKHGTVLSPGYVCGKCLREPDETEASRCDCGHAIGNHMNLKEQCAICHCDRFIEAESEGESHAKS